MFFSFPCDGNVYRMGCSEVLLRNSSWRGIFDRELFCVLAGHWEQGSASDVFSVDEVCVVLQVAV